MLVQNPLASIAAWYSKPRVSAPQRAEIYTALASMIEAGKKISEALSTLYDNYSDDGKNLNASTAIMLYEVNNLVVGGKPVGEAFAKWVTPTERSLIDAGYEAGHLEVTFRNAAHLITVQHRLATKLKMALPQPVMLFGSTAFMLYLVGHKVVPTFQRIVSADQWGGAGLIMYWLSFAVENFGVAFLVASTALFAWVVWAMPRLSGNTKHFPHFCGQLRYRLDKILPFSLYRRMNGAVFCLGVSIMVQAGIQLSVALTTLAANANPYLKERIDACRDLVVGGKGFGEALRLSDYDFPDRKSIRLLSAYDTLENFDKALRAYAEDEIVRVETFVTVAVDTMLNATIIINTLVGVIVLLGGTSIQDAMPGI